MTVRDDSVIIDCLGVADTELSDHRTVFCSLSARKPDRVKQKVTSRNLRRIDPTRFQTDVSRVASSLAECPDCELLEEFNASLRNVLDRNAPLVTRTVTARPSAPWITEEVKAAKCNLRKAEMRWCSIGLSVRKQIFIEQRNVKKQTNKNNEYFFLLNVNTFARNCQSVIQASQYGLNNELLGNSESSVFPSDVPESELPDHFCSFFDQKIASICIELDS